MSQKTCQQHIVELRDKVRKSIPSLLPAKFYALRIVNKTKTGQLFIAFTLALIWLSACSAPTKKAENSQNSLRIVSLVPSITKELESLGLSDKIVGATSYCNITKQKEELIIGNATNINLEKILLLKPSIVFSSGLVKESNVKALRKNGIEVYEVGKMHSYQEICDELIAIATLVNKKELAENIIQNSQNTIDSLQNSIPVIADSLKLFFQIGAQPIFSVIPNTYMDDLIHFAGCKNIAYDMQHGSISRESVLLRNPDVIVVTTMGILGQEEINTWKKYTQLNAVQQNKLFVVDSDLACSPSVTAFTQTLEILFQYIYN